MIELAILLVFGVLVAGVSGAIYAVRRVFTDLRAAIADREATLTRLAANQQRRTQAGRKGAEITNAKKAKAKERHRQHVLAVAEQMKRDMAAKKEAIK